MQGLHDPEGCILSFKLTYCQNHDDNLWESISSAVKCWQILMATRWWIVILHWSLDLFRGNWLTFEIKQDVVIFFFFLNHWFTSLFVCMRLSQTEVRCLFLWCPTLWSRSSYLHILLLAHCSEWVQLHISIWVEVWHDSKVMNWAKLIKNNILENNMNFKG